MFVYIPSKVESKIIIIDTEYSEQNIIQFSALLLEKTNFNDEIYQLVSSANVYMARPIKGGSPTTSRTYVIRSFFGLCHTHFILTI